MSLVIEQDLEELLTGWLKTKEVDFVQDRDATRQRIYKGLENEEKANVTKVEGDDPNAPEEGEESRIIRVPCITVICDSADPIGPEFCGNYEIEAQFEVTSSAYDTTNNEHKARVQKVWELIMQDDLLEQLQAFSSDFSTSKIVFGKRGYRFDGDCWTSYMVLLFRHFFGRKLDGGN